MNEVLNLYPGGTRIHDPDPDPRIQHFSARHRNPRLQSPQDPGLVPGEFCAQAVPSEK
jgi:hypothetical protein